MFNGECLELRYIISYMDREKIINKIYSSVPILVLLYGLPFGIIMYFVSNYHSIVGLIAATVGGVLFGISMAYFQKKRFKGQLQVMDDTKVAKIETLDTYLNRTELPTTKPEKDKLIGYMKKLEYKQKILNERLYPHKYSKISIYGLITLFFIFTFSMKELRYLAVVYPIVIAISLYGEYKNKVMKERIAAMRRKMDE